MTLGDAQAGGERGNHLVGVAAHDGVAGSDAQVVERGLVEVRPGPQQRCAVTEKAGSGGDHPDQNGEGADAGAQRDPEAAAGDQLRGLGGLGDVEGVAREKLDKGIVAITLGESGEALLELGKAASAVPIARRRVRRRKGTANPAAAALAKIKMSAKRAAVTLPCEKASALAIVTSSSVATKAPPVRMAMPRRTVLQRRRCSSCAM